MIAEVLEWKVRDRNAVSATSRALYRYYSVVLGDSASTRYIASMPETDRLIIRAQVTSNDPVGRLLMIRYGQIQLFSTEDIRIALGEDLYATLLDSRNESGTNAEVLSLGNRFGHHDWLGSHRVVWSLFDRIDIRLGDRTNVFLALGAPESGRDFWTDGTGRIGLAHPLGEISMLFPFSGGSIGLGSWFPGRLLSPGIGGALTIEAGDIEGRLRYTLPYEGTINATRPVDDAWVPTLSAELNWEGLEYSGDQGSYLFTVGGAFEEVTRIFDGGRRGLIRSGYVRRFSPVVTASYHSPDETLRLDLGTYNLGLRAVATARLTSALWFEVRMMYNDVREVDPFEPPVVLFMTPRIKF